MTNPHDNELGKQVHYLQTQIDELKKRPKPIPPKHPRRPLPWPRAAVKIAYIVVAGLNLFAVILLIVAIVSS